MIYKRFEKVIPPGIEPGTLSVLDSRDNRYTMESRMSKKAGNTAYKLFSINGRPFLCHANLENVNSRRSRDLEDSPSKLLRNEV